MSKQGDPFLKAADAVYKVPAGSPLGLIDAGSQVGVRLVSVSHESSATIAA